MTLSNTLTETFELLTHHAYFVTVAFLLSRLCTIPPVFQIIFSLINVTNM
jgi:hypothetical protein